MSLREAKKVLRKSVRERLSRLTAEEVVDQSKHITVQVLELPVYQQAQRISVFLSMPNREVQTREIVLHAISQGKKVFVPHIHIAHGEPGQKPESVMDMLALFSTEDLDSLKPDPWGIPSIDDASVTSRENALPKPANAAIQREGMTTESSVPGLDLILMPGLAFDRENGRLGHGKGFYDRYLRLYKNSMTAENRKAQMPLLVGLALSQQVLPRGELVPCGEDDWKVDKLIAGA